MGPEFFQTVMGRQFYDSTVPKLVEEIGRLAKAMDGKPRMIQLTRVDGRPLVVSIAHVQSVTSDLVSDRIDGKDEHEATMVMVGAETFEVKESVQDVLKLLLD